jgi:hypothetical protein
MRINEVKGKALHMGTIPSIIPNGKDASMAGTSW